MAAMTDDAIRLEIKFLRDRLTCLEDEQRRRAHEFMNSKLGSKGAEEFRRATSEALDTPSAARQMFTITPVD